MNSDLIVEAFEPRPPSIFWLSNQFATSADRISNPAGKMFAIVGYVRDTRNEPQTQYVKNGNPVDFEYIEEHVVGKGQNFKQLRESVRNHKRLMCISMSEYLTEELLL